MATPKVSICVPTYNQTLYLEKNLNSIAIQTFQDYEIIVSDDSSTDDVLNLVSRFETTFKDKLKYFRNNPPKGTPENWNESIRKAKGEYIKIMHHDEWFADENSLETFVSTIELNNADFVFSAVNVLIEKENKEWVLQPTILEVNDILANPVNLLLGNILGAPSSTIYQKDIVLVFDKTLKYVVDFEFYIRVIQKGKKVVYINSPIINSVSNASHNVSAECNTPDIELCEYMNLYDKLKELVQNKDKKKYIKLFLGLFMKYKIFSSSKLKAYYPKWNGKGYYLKIIYLAKIFKIKKKYIWFKFFV